MASSIWRQINTMGSWAFNQSHAVAYGLVSYYCAYLKAHYPLEFAAATLDLETNSDRQIELLRELKAEGINYKPFDPELSTDRWQIDKVNKIVVGPLTSIKGIGPAFVREIMAARESGEPLRPALAERLVKAETSIDSLYPIADAIKRLHPDLKKSGIISIPKLLADVQL